MQLHCCPLLGKSGLAAAAIVQPPPQSVLRRVCERHYVRQTRILATPITDAGPAATAPLQQGPSAHTQPSPTHADRQQAHSEAEAQPRYLSYAEYVAMQEQRQREQEQQSLLEGAGQRADETAHASTSAPSQDGSGKRVPWNTGRKHSAMTIARIKEATTRALARPEIRAKLDAWNQSRIGSKVSEDRKAMIAERQRAAMVARRENMTEEDIAAYKAKRSDLAKRLWQDPDYAEKTRAAIQAAGSRRRTRPQQTSADAGGSSSSSSSSSARKSSRRRTAESSSSDEAGAAVQVEQQLQVEVEVEGQQWQQQHQQPQAQKVTRKPTQKELAALAQQKQEHQQEQLQKQLERMLQTQRLIATTEQTIVQLRSNMAAFENNPQAKAKAAAALQQAQAYLEPARLQVNKMQESLDKHGVHWDPASGRMTHINNQPIDGKQEPQARKVSKAAGAAQHSSSGGSSSSKSGSRRQAAAAAPDDLGPDVVRSSRTSARQHPSGSEAGRAQTTADGLVVSSRRRAAAAEAAASGGSRVGAVLKPVLTPVDIDVGQNGTYSNGHSSVYNGNGKNGHSSGGGGHYEVLLTQQPLSSVEDDEL